MSFALQEIGSKENIPNCLARAKDKSDPFRLMGFGHRVRQPAEWWTTSCPLVEHALKLWTYNALKTSCSEIYRCSKFCIWALLSWMVQVYKTYDPRAQIMRDVCYQLIESLNIEWVSSPMSVTNQSKWKFIIIIAWIRPAKFQCQQCWTHSCELGCNH